jgi:hypothetical protein
MKSNFYEKLRKKEEEWKNTRCIHIWNVLNVGNFATPQII